MVDQDPPSCRIVRRYKPLPLHSHDTSDENVYVLSGEALFQLEDRQQEIRPGMFIQFPRGAVHGILALKREPLVVLTIDTPRRPDEDVTFLDPNVGDARSFNGA